MSHLNWSNVLFAAQRKFECYFNANLGRLPRKLAKCKALISFKEEKQSLTGYKLYRYQNSGYQAILKILKASASWYTIYRWSPQQFDRVPILLNMTKNLEGAESY